MHVAITGSEGLIGRALSKALLQGGHETTGLDLLASRPADVRDGKAARALAAHCDGIVHLAAVSRVVWGERDPAECRSVNVDGTRSILAAAAAAAATPRPPFVIVASSREVYGEPDRLPVREDAPLRAINIYGETKVEGERLALAARAEGVRTAVLRFSNVYGDVRDHPDRVVPAFARTAARGGELRVDGEGHTFDFTHVDDVVRGILLLCDLLASDAPPPDPLHLVSGSGTTLGELAALAIEASGGRAHRRLAPERDYDVANFVGDPSRASRILGWKAEIPLESGFERLVRAFRS